MTENSDSDSTETVCPECGSEDLLWDSERAEVICGDCGFLVEEETDDSEPEWRSFDSDENDKGMTTNIDWREKDSYGKQGMGSDNKEIEVVSTVEEPSEYKPCSYTHDIGDEAIFEDLKSEEWNCRHPAEEDFDHCLFHLPTENKEKDVVTQRLLGVLNDGYDYDGVDIPTEERLRFIGAEFADFVLEGDIEIDPQLEDDTFFDLRDVRIRGDLKLDSVGVYCDTKFDGGEISGTTRLAGTDFYGNLSFDKTKLLGNPERPVIFGDVSIEGDLRFGDSDIFAIKSGQVEPSGYEEYVFDSVYLEELRVGGDVTFESAEVDGDITFVELSLDGDLDLEGVDVGRLISIYSEGIGGSIFLAEAEIDDSLGFDGELDGSLSCDGSDIGGRVRVSGTVGGDVAFTGKMRDRVYLGSTEVGGDLTFTDATVIDRADFSEMRIEGDANFRRSRFGDDVDFTRTEAGGKGQFEKASFGGEVLLDEAVFEEGTCFDGSII